MENTYITTLSPLLVGIVLLLFEYFIIMPVTKSMASKTTVENNAIAKNKPVRAPTIDSGIAQNVPAENKAGTNTSTNLKVEGRKNWFIFNSTFIHAIKRFINIICFLLIVFSADRLSEILKMIVAGMTTVTVELSDGPATIPLFSGSLHSDPILAISLYCVVIVFALWVLCSWFITNNLNTPDLVSFLKALLFLSLVLPLLSILLSLWFSVQILITNENVLFILEPLGGIFFCVYCLTAVSNYLNYLSSVQAKITTQDFLAKVGSKKS